MQDNPETLIENILNSDKAFYTLSQQTMPKSLLITKLEDAGIFASHIDRAPVFDKDSLLHALYQGCMMPAYFGFNWDALEDSLNDFSWMVAEAYVLVFTGFDTLEERAPDVAATFKEIVEDVYEKRREEKRVPLCIILLTA